MIKIKKKSGHCSIRSYGSMVKIKPRKVAPTRGISVHERTEGAIISAAAVFSFYIAYG